jgi:hypothetical protein
MLAAYRKTITALVGVAILVLSTELGADSRWVTYAIALAAAIGVYSVPNKTNA